MPQWLVELVGESLAPIVWVAIAAIFVILLATLMILLARKAFGSSMSPRAKGRAPRLAIMDVASIDQKRRLVLVRRDEVEHLILVGGQNDLLVESSILRVAGAARNRSEPAFRQVEATEPDEIALLDRVMAPRADKPIAASPPQPAAAPRQPQPAAARAAVQPGTEPRPASQPAPAAAAPRHAAAPRPVSPGAAPNLAPPVSAPAPKAAPATVVSATMAAIPAAAPRPVAPAVRLDEGLVPQRREAPAGAQAEPQRRPPVQAPSAAQPRSMATPTLPPPRSPADGAPEATAGGVDLSRHPATRDAAEGPRDTAKPGEQTPARQESPVAQLPMEGPDRIALRNRLNSAQGADIGTVGEATVPSSSSAPGRERPAMEARPAPQVRSFASLIQNRQGPAEMPPPVMPPRQAGPPAAQPPVADTPRREVRVEPSLEDFLTAELSTGFGSDEPEKPAPRPEPQAATPPVAPSPRQAVPAPTAAPAPNRPLTLEEEMERLLGDFTLDISDRRK